MNKRKKILKISIIGLFAIICSVVVISISNASAETNEKVSYSHRSAYDEKEDGWIYAFEVFYPNLESEDNIYMFDGYNLKYKQLEGYYVPVIDSSSNEIIDKITPEFSTLSISEKYGKDIKNIVDYFNQKQFGGKISVDDLKDLIVYNFDKEYIVGLYNKAVESELKSKPGEYVESHSIGKVYAESTDDDVKGEWQLSYLMDYGDIYKVNIEFINENGNYLSDKSEKNEFESTMMEKANNIEKNININEKRSVRKSISNNSSDSVNKDLNNLISNFMNYLTE